MKMKDDFPHFNPGKRSFRRNIMNIEHFIYTRLEKAHSPSGQSGFQIAFQPSGLLGKKERLTIEGNIVYPQRSGIAEKHTMFFLKLNDRNWLVLLNYTDQPEGHRQFPEKVGTRSGIFLCHGFLVPEEIWRRLPSPWSAMELVGDKLLTGLDQVFSSDFIDFSTGATTPLEITDADMDRLSDTLPAIRGRGEWNIVFYLLRSVAQHDSPKILFKGPPSQARQVMDRICGFLPWALMPYCSWDTGMDNGDLYNAAFQLAAYERIKPKGGRPIEVDCANISFDIPDDYSTPLRQNPGFDAYLSVHGEHISSRSELEAGWQLGLFLRDGDRQQHASLSLVPGFAQANQQAIDDLFHSALSRAGLSSPELPDILQSLDTDQRLELVLQGMPANKLAAVMEKAILARIPSPERLQQLLTPRLMEHCGQFLQTLSILVRKRRLDSTDIPDLPAVELSRLTDYLLSHYSSEKWLLDLVGTDCPLAREIIDADQGTRTQGLSDLVRLFTEVKTGADNQVARIVAQEVVYSGKAGDYLASSDPTAFMLDLLEKHVRSRGFDQRLLTLRDYDFWKRTLPADVSSTEPAEGDKPRPEGEDAEILGHQDDGHHVVSNMAQEETPVTAPLGMPPHPYPCLYAFLEPDCPAIPAEIGENPRLREDLLEVYVKRHKLMDTDLLAKGFTIQEIHQVRPPRKNFFSGMGRKHSKTDLQGGERKEDGNKGQPSEKTGLLSRIFGFGKKKR